MFTTGTPISPANFKDTIQKYCSKLGWNIAEIDNNHAFINFSGGSGHKIPLMILRHDNSLDFSILTRLSFDTETDIPHDVSTVLLQRNSSLEFGFWCIQMLEGNKPVFVLMHNANLQLITADYFGQAISNLLDEANKFDKIVTILLE